MKWDLQSRLLTGLSLWMQGEIVEENTPEEFFNNPQNVRTKTFLDQILS
jgi:ABC-type polar amino acid transport system ATPase subunit